MEWYEGMLLLFLGGCGGTPGRVRDGAGTADGRGGRPTGDELNKFCCCSATADAAAFDMCAAL